MNGIDLAVVIAYFILTLGVGLWVTRSQKTAGDYFLGARDLPAFKRFLRTHQVPAEVFFSAYPRETVLNIVDDSRWLAGRTPSPGEV